MNSKLICNFVLLVEKPLELDTPTQQKRVLPETNGVDKKPDRDLTIPLITIRKPSTPGPGNVFIKSVCN